MKLELRRPRAIGPASKLLGSLRLLSTREGISQDVARRIISISKNDDQARSIHAIGR